jgi:arginine exporter protein ArgO
VAFGLGALLASSELVWFALLIVAARPIARALKRPSVIRPLDRLTGLVFLTFG